MGPQEAAGLKMDGDSAAHGIEIGDQVVYRDVWDFATYGKLISVDEGIATIRVTDTTTLMRVPAGGLQRPASRVRQLGGAPPQLWPPLSQLRATLGEAIAGAGEARAVLASAEATLGRADAAVAAAKSRVAAYDDIDAQIASAAAAALRAGGDGAARVSPALLRAQIDRRDATADLGRARAAQKILEFEREEEVAALRGAEAELSLAAERVMAAQVETRLFALASEMTRLRRDLEDQRAIADLWFTGPGVAPGQIRIPPGAAAAFDQLAWVTPEPQAQPLEIARERTERWRALHAQLMEDPNASADD